MSGEQKNLLRVSSLFFLSFFFYEEHFVQPHLTTFSTSWTKEDPSVHWNVYFLRLLRRGVQQVPCPSAPPGQLPRHSKRETFSWVWHAAQPCCLWQTSRTRSPRQATSADTRNRKNICKVSKVFTENSTNSAHHGKRLSGFGNKVRNILGMIRHKEDSKKSKKRKKWHEHEE